MRTYRITTNGTVYKVQRTRFGLIWYNPYGNRSPQGATFDSYESAERNMQHLMRDEKMEMAQRGRFYTIITVAPENI